MTAPKDLDGSDNNQLFCAIGQAMYGDRWKSAFADALNMSDRMIRLYAAGTQLVPHHVLDTACLLAAEQSGYLRHLVDLRDAAIARLSAADEARNPDVR